MALEYWRLLANVNSRKIIGMMAKSQDKNEKKFDKNYNTTF